MQQNRQKLKMQENSQNEAKIKEKMHHLVFSDLHEPQDA